MTMPKVTPLLSNGEHAASDYGIRTIPFTEVSSSTLVSQPVSTVSRSNSVHVHKRMSWHSLGSLGWRRGSHDVNHLTDNEARLTSSKSSRNWWAVFYTTDRIWPNWRPVSPVTTRCLQTVCLVNTSSLTRESHHRSIGNIGSRVLQEQLSGLLERDTMYHEPFTRFWSGQWPYSS